MAYISDKPMETALIKMVNEYFDTKVRIEKYQKVDVYIRDQDIIKNILKQFKFKDIGNVYDYPDELPQPEYINGMDLIINYDLFQRICISKKFNSAAIYTFESYSTHCVFFVDVLYLEEFSKKVKDLLRQDSGFNIFKNTDFNCKGDEYIEISSPEEDKSKPCDTIKKKVSNNENLIFDKSSVINDVMKDIITFFKPEARELYEKLKLPYKRGIMIHGYPGNGKSAMIREIIRTIPDISKVVINVDVNHITKVLKSLVKALNGNRSIIVIEDFDSMITDYNRSELLNIFDGVDITSGICFIGTTNYPDRIDPAFMNRSGRFDRKYQIDNPNEKTRKKFFKSREVGKLLSDYDVYRGITICEPEKEITKLFVENSKDLPMASLKELITSTSYILASSDETTVYEAVKKSYDTIIRDMSEHNESHMKFKKNMMPMQPYRSKMFNDLYF